MKEKNKNYLIFIGIFVLAIAGVGAFLIMNKDKDASKLVCKKDGMMLDESITLTYSEDKIVNYLLEYNMDETVDTSLLSEDEMDDIAMVTFATLGFANYGTYDGVTFNIDKKDSVDNVPFNKLSFEIDVNKVTDKELLDEFLSDFDGMSKEEIKKQSVSMGYTCE